MRRKLLIALIAIVVLALAGVAVWWVAFRGKETFAYDGALTGVALGGNPVNTYSLIEPPANTFADIVAPAERKNRDPACARLPLPTKASANIDTRDLLPDVNTHATSYDVDVSDPEVFMWRPSIRTAIHNRQQEAADPYRGDLPITKSGCGFSNNGWFSSRYNEGDAKLDALFSEFGKEKYRVLTGNRSMPQHIVNEGTIMDYQPKTEQIVTEWY